MVALSVYRPYHYDHVENIIINSSIIPIVVHDFMLADAPVGLWEIKFAMIFSSPDTNDFVQFTYRSSAGTIQSTTVRKEARDADDIITFSFNLPRVHVAGDLNIVVEGLLEAGGQNATVLHSTVTYEKKGE